MREIMGSIDLMVANEAAEYAGKTLGELAELARTGKLRAVPVKHCTERFYDFHDVMALRPQAASTIYSKGAAPSNGRKSAGAQRDQRNPQGAMRALADKLQDTATPEPEPPAIDYQTEVEELSQLPKAELVPMAEDLGISKPDKIFRRRALAELIVIEKNKAWYAKYPPKGVGVKFGPVVSRNTGPAVVRSTATVTPISTRKGRRGNGEVRTLFSHGGSVNAT